MKALETRRDPGNRRAWKWTIVKSLYERGWSGDNVRMLFRFIDWVMSLPKELEESFWQEYYAFEEEKRMPFITSVERIGMEKGVEKGRKLGERDMLLEIIADDLNSRFPPDAEGIMPKVSELEDVDALRAARKALMTARTPDEFCAALAEIAKPVKPS